MSDDKYFKGFTIIDEPLYDPNSEFSLKYAGLIENIGKLKKEVWEEIEKQRKAKKLEKIWKIHKWEESDG